MNALNRKITNPAHNKILTVFILDLLFLLFVKKPESETAGMIVNNYHTMPDIAIYQMLLQR